MEIKIAIKETKNIVTLKSINSLNLREFISSFVHKSTTQIRHPTLNNIVIFFHERKPGESKDENFKINAFNKIIYGPVVFVKTTEDGTILSITNEDYKKILQSFKNFSITVIKEYIKGGESNDKINA